MMFSQLPQYLLLLVLALLSVQPAVDANSALPPCPIGSKQKEFQATVAMAVTPSQTNRCGKDFMVSMDRKNGEPSVVVLSFDSSVVSLEKRPAILELFASADARDFPPQNSTVFGVSSSVTNSDSWDTLGTVLKPFDPSSNWMTVCSENIIQEDAVMDLGTLSIPHSEVVNAYGGMTFQIDVSKAIAKGIHSFALARMIECDVGQSRDVPRGNIILSSLCPNDTDFQGQQYPPRLVLGKPSPPPKCSFKRGYYKIHIKSTSPITNRRAEYFLTHSLKSKDKTIAVTSIWWIHKLSKSRRLWKIREDTVSGTAMTFFGVKRRTKYSYLGGTKKNKPSLGTKKDSRMRILPRELRCFQVDCNNVYLVSDRRKRQGKPSYLTINVENPGQKTVSWKYSSQADWRNGLYQLIPS